MSDRPSKPPQEELNDAVATYKETVGACATGMLDSATRLRRAARSLRRRVADPNATAATADETAQVPAVKT